MLEPSVRTRLGGVAVVTTAVALAIGQRGPGVFAGIALLALWLFVPAAYVFVGGQLAVIALTSPSALDWTLLVAEIGLAVALLAPSIQTAENRRQLSVVIATGGCIAVTWFGLREFGTIVVAATVVAVAAVAATAFTRYGRVLIRGGVQ
ncbi:hypothetical protein [Haladaptatus cibarius]|uniref:hypothetical protein n=1 Tax=Haladaptatus cibarius TaxID=453847 RepID=UPI0006786153|nr:hypothetical protein [Haladaptatus cibarius]